MRGEFIDLAGCRLYYYAAGTRGAGEPVVFLHGFPASSHLWANVVRLMPAGHRLVVLDLVGYGRSDRSGTEPLTVERHAGHVKGLLDELQIGECCVVGHAMGGAVAQALALGWPERVTRLALVNSVAFDAWPSGAARLARAAAALPSFARALGAPLLAGLVHGSLLTGYADPEVGRHSLDVYLHPFTKWLGTDALIAGLQAMHDPTVELLGERLVTLSQPTAVLWGAMDPFLPVTGAERLRDAIPGATLEVIDGARHFTPEDASERVASAVAALLRR